MGPFLQQMFEQRAATSIAAPTENGHVHCSVFGKYSVAFQSRGKNASHT